jgi:hypothetical protein
VLPENDARRIREGRLFRRDGSSSVPGETSRLNCSDGRRVCGDGCPAPSGREDEGADEPVDSVGDESPAICHAHKKHHHQPQMFVGSSL